MTKIVLDFAERHDAISRTAVIAYLRKQMVATARLMAADGLEVGASHTLANLEHVIRLIETMPATERADA